jgi:5-methylcytosine-specific restriction protein A
MPQKHTYLLTWNPDVWKWESLGDDAAVVRASGMEDRWSCANRRVEIGDTLYLMRLGRAPRGIIGAGEALTPTYTAPHWDESKGNRPRRYVDLRWSALLDPSTEPILPFDWLRDHFPGMMWASRMSGIKIPDAIAAALAVEWQRFLDKGA